MKYSLLIILLALSSCEDFFVTTQKKAPEIIMTTDTFYADGETIENVKLVLGSRPSKNEMLVVNISSGHLVELPSSDYLDSSLKELAFNPKDDTLEFAIVSSKKPSDKVILGIGVNTFYVQDTLIYKRVCPDEIHLDLFKKEFNSSDIMQDIGVIDLSNKFRQVSDSTRVDISLNTDSLVTMASRVFYSGRPITLKGLPNNKGGELEITIKVAQEGCQNESKAVSKKIELMTES